MTRLRIYEILPGWQRCRDNVTRPTIRAHHERSFAVPTNPELQISRMVIASITIHVMYGFVFG